ncbi:MAG: transposase, partial [Caldicoprobacterales bacterium]
MREGVLFLPATRDKDILQEMLEAEMDVHLGYSKGEKPLANSDNTRNGYSSKTVRSELGPIELDIPRNRKGEYNLKIVLFSVTIIVRVLLRVFDRITGLNPVQVESSSSSIRGGKGEALP